MLLEVNESGEASKSGCDPQAAVDIAAQIAQLDGIRLEGLMTIGAHVDDEATIRACFAHLRGTRDGEDLRLVYCGGARFLAVKPDAPDTVVCHLEFLIRAGRAWGVRVGTRVFERD